MFINHSSNTPQFLLRFMSSTCYRYEDEREIEIIIPKLESNIWFLGDYRTKEEIISNNDNI